jgi:hypothetical protein
MPMTEPMPSFYSLEKETAWSMITLYPSTKRLHPTYHDWNDMLIDSLLKSNLDNRCNFPLKLRDKQ